MRTPLDMAPSNGADSEVVQYLNKEKIEFEKL